MCKLLNYTEFCRKNELNVLSPESQIKYRIYIEKFNIENRPVIDEMRKKAKEIKNELTKKRKQ